MNRRKAQLLLLAIMIPIGLAVAYTIYAIWNGYQPSVELILTVGGVLFIQAFLATFTAGKRRKKKP